MTNSLENLFKAQDNVLRWRAERENASARLDLALVRKNMAHIISQYEPVNKLGIDREKLSLLFNFIIHGNINRLDSEIDDAERDKGDML